MRLRDLNGHKVVMWGAGRECNALIGAARRSNVVMDLAVVDEQPEGPEFTSEGIAVLRGDATYRALEGAEIVVRSPGVSRYHHVVERLQANGVAMTTATNLWFAESHAPIIGVTGTKGKSTTASLIAHLLDATGHDVRLAGNIGRSPLDLIGVIEEPHWWVLELSSYQTSDLICSPTIGVLTSLSPEHLSWHGNYERYIDDKLRLFVYPELQRSVVNAADAGARSASTRLVNVVQSGISSGIHIEQDSGLSDGPGVAAFFDGEAHLFSAENMQLLGLHNKQLVSLALTTLAVAGISLQAKHDAIAEALAAFRPLEHRLQPVAHHNNVLYVDDGLSTTPVATLAALDAFSRQPATVLLGGQDRGVPFDELAQYVAQRNDVSVVTMPDSGYRIAATIGAALLGRGRTAETVHQADGLEAAVHLAAEITPAGGVILLSPGAPSFGRFRNYEERSAAFCHYVDQLSNHAVTA